MGQEIQQGQENQVAVVAPPAKAVLPSVSIPPGMSQLLQSSWSVATAREEWVRPRSVTRAQKALAAELLTEARSRYWPAPSERLKNRLQAFLGHWYVADDAAMEGRFVDWMRVFSEFPLLVVDSACVEYLRFNDKKPAIAALRVLCQQVDDLGRLIGRLRVVVEQVPVAADAPEPVTAEERARVGAWLAVARRCGYRLDPDQLAAMQRGEMPPVLQEVAS